MTSMRSRWAAIGAAVAVTLGAGGISLGQAAIGSGDKPVFVAIEPCRLVDTRPGDVNIGGRTTPLGANDTLTLEITGSTGECSGIPADATAAAMNVTAIQGSTRSYLSIYPADGSLPNASNLNWNGGDPPTPNKVDVALSPTGAVKITNNAGTVHVAADLVGYYIDHHHDDRYYTKSQVNALASRSFVVEGEPTTIAVDPVSDEIVANTLTVTAPGPGQFLLTATGNYSAVLQDGLHAAAQCSLTDGTTYDPNYRSLFEVWVESIPALANARSEADLSVTRVIDVAAAGDLTISLICRQTDGRALVVSRIVAQYVP